MRGTHDVCVSGVTSSPCIRNPDSGLVQVSLSLPENHGQDFLHRLCVTIIRKEEAIELLGLRQKDSRPGRTVMDTRMERMEQKGDESLMRSVEQMEFRGNHVTGSRVTLHLKSIPVSPAIISSERMYQELHQKAVTHTLPLIPSARHRIPCS